MSTAIDTMSNLVYTMGDDLKSDITDINESIAKLKSTQGTLQTLLAITLIVSIISAIAPFIRKTTS